MKVGYLFQSTFRQILSRKAMFLLSTILLCITFLIIVYQTLIVGIFFYQKHVVKDIVVENQDDIFILDFGKYMMPTDEDIDELNQFGILMKNVEGIKYSGVCYEDEIGIGGVDEKVMAISADLCSLCQLKNVEGNAVSFTERKKKALPGSRRTERKTSEKQFVLVGYNLRKDYPVGYTFTDQTTEIEYVVTDILQQGSQWFEERLEFGNLEIDLDDCLIVDEDVRLQVGDDRLFGLAAFIYVKEPKTDAAQIKEAMISLAKECGLDLYNVQSVRKILEKNKQSVFDDPIQYYLVIIMLILALTVAIVCSMINVFLRKNSIGIMYALGYSIRDVQGMVLLENVIKIGVAFAVAYAYWHVSEMELYGGMNISILRYMLPWLVSGTVIMMWISSILPIRKLSKMYPATLIGGKE